MATVNSEIVLLFVILPQGEHFAGPQSEYEEHADDKPVSVI